MLLSIRIVQVCDDFFQGSLAAKERKEHKDWFGSFAIFCGYLRLVAASGRGMKYSG
jgi:hypothetical protein